MEAELALSHGVRVCVPSAGHEPNTLIHPPGKRVRRQNEAHVTRFNSACPPHSPTSTPAINGRTVLKLFVAALSESEKPDRSCGPNTEDRVT